MISELFAMYQFGALHAADIRDDKVTNQVLCSAESRLLVCLLSECHCVYHQAACNDVFNLSEA